MTAIGLATFAAIFAIAAASPGPAVAAVLARVMAKGTAGISFFIAGLLLGDLVWLSCAVFGLAALAALFQPLFLALKYLGAAYLLYLAWKLWTAPPAAPVAAEPVRGSGWSLFLPGLLLAMGNPKTMLFYLAVLPTVIDLAQLTPLGFAEIAAIIAVLFVVIFGGYVLLAAQARRLFTSARSVRIVNRTSGLAMAGAAAAIVVRE
jgi:threonine/homoserine/homoserine lactone efflux protein